MNNNLDDLISRQAAIDAINHICPVDTEYDCTLLDRVDVRYVLSELPSAQSENIRCKDCNVHGICRFELGLGENGYCSQAQRRNENGNL